MNDCDHAVRILEGNSFSLKRAGGSFEVGIEKASRIHEVMQLLNDKTFMLSTGNQIRFIMGLDFKRNSARAICKHAPTLFEQYL